MNKKHFYNAYGVRLASDGEINFAVSSTESNVSDIYVDLSACNFVASPDLPTEPKFGFERTAGGSGAHLWFTGSGRLDFKINGNADFVSVSGHQTNGPEMSLLLLGQVFGALLRLRGILSLHACAINIQGVAVIVLGTSGAGKSTLAAHLASTGSPVLADDVAALIKSEGAWTVQPGFPAMKFWPDTLQACGMPADKQDRVFNFSNKRVVTLNKDNGRHSWRFQSTPLSLGGIFVLQPRRSDLNQPKAQRLAPIAAIPQLMPHRSAGTCDFGRTTNARELMDMAELTSSVPVWSITSPDDLRLVSATVDLLRQCLEQGATA